MSSFSCSRTPGERILFILFLPSRRSLASVQYMQGFEGFQSRDPVGFKTPDLAAYDFADLVDSNLHRHRSFLM
jgi:hypothetical protein